MSIIDSPVLYYKKNVKFKAREFYNTDVGINLPLIKHKFKEDLENLYTPSDEIIANKQLMEARKIYGYSSKDIEIRNFLNNVTHMSEADKDIALETDEITALFEKWFLNNERLVNIGDKEENMTTNRTNNASDLVRNFNNTKNAEVKFKEVLTDLEKINEVINNYEKAGVNFLNTGDIINAKRKIEIGITNIHAYLDTGTYTDMDKGKTIFGTDTFYSKANPLGSKNSKSVLAQMSKISNALKGRYNEIRAIEAVEKMKIHNLTIVDTATWKIAGSSNYADILIGNSHVKLSCRVNGKQFKGTLEELEKFLNSIEVDAAVDMTNAEWNDFITKNSNKLVMGQVKSGVFQNPFNNKSRSLNSLILQQEHHKYAIALACFIEWYKNGSNIYASSVSNISTKNYEALANYLLSKSTNLKYIINENEKMLVMRGQIYSTWDYLNEMWKVYGRYIRFVSPVDLAKPDNPITIGIRNKPATYSADKK